MITKKVQYEPKNPYIFLDEKRRAIAQMRKKISKLGIDPNELGLFTRDRYRVAYDERSIDNQ
jgi:hypothetical protein